MKKVIKLLTYISLSSACTFVSANNSFAPTGAFSSFASNGAFYLTYAANPSGVIIGPGDISDLVTPQFISKVDPKFQQIFVYSRYTKVGNGLVCFAIAGVNPRTSGATNLPAQAGYGTFVDATTGFFPVFNQIRSCEQQAVRYAVSHLMQSYN